MDHWIKCVYRFELWNVWEIYERKKNKEILIKMRKKWENMKWKVKDKQLPMFKLCYTMQVGYISRCEFEREEKTTIFWLKIVKFSYYIRKICSKNHFWMAEWLNVDHFFKRLRFKSGNIHFFIYHILSYFFLSISRKIQIVHSTAKDATFGVYYDGVHTPKKLKYSKMNFEKWDF